MPLAVVKLGDFLRSWLSVELFDSITQWQAAIDHVLPSTALNLMNSISNLIERRTRASIMTHGKLEQLFVLVSQIGRHCRIDVVTLRRVETDKR